MSSSLKNAENTEKDKKGTRVPPLTVPPRTLRAPCGFHFSLHDAEAWALSNFLNCRNHEIM